MASIEIKTAKGQPEKRPFLAFVNGQMLKRIDGAGRRFATEEAARRAAEKEAR